MSISLYSSVGRAGDCNVNVDIPRSLVRIQLERYLRLCGRVVYGASLRHWSLRRRGFKSRHSHFVVIFKKGAENVKNVEVVKLQKMLKL